MANNRDPRVNTIIELLAEITEDQSLSNFGDLCDPKTVQSSFDFLWKLYNKPTIATLLTFEQGYTQPRNKIFNTWVSIGTIPHSRGIVCSVCNKGVYLFVQVDTSDNCFQNVRETIIHIYTCEDGHEFTILGTKEVIELKSTELKDIYFIKGRENVMDKPRTVLNILVPDKSKCLDCPLGGPMKIKGHSLTPNIHSKAGGYAPKRDFKLHSKVFHNKIKLYSNSDHIQLVDRTPISCHCFNPLTSNIVLFLNHVELPCFNDRSISQIKVEKCSECGTLNVLIYSQELNINHPSVIFDVEDFLYHILMSKDHMNGVVISVDKRNHEIKAICQLTDFEYVDRENINCNKITTLDETQISTLKDHMISIGTSYLKFKKFFKNYLEKYTTLEIVRNNLVIDIYGDNFNVVAPGNILSGCLIEQDDEDIIIHGNITFQERDIIINPLNMEQKDLVIKLGAIVGKLNKSG